MANVSQLQPFTTPQLQTSSSDAQEKDADFLALRLLNKRARLRLSPEPLNLSAFRGKVNLFATVNSKGCFAAVTRDDSGTSVLILSTLADLRSALASASPEDEQSFTPQRRVPINGAPPHILTFAFNDSRMLLGLLDGSILVYDVDKLLTSGEGPMQPLHAFVTTSSAPILSIQPNPGDIPELVAVLRDCASTPGSLSVELLDVQKLVSTGGWVAGSSPSTTPASISWSPKGKQLALGLQSGDIVAFSPTATASPKSSIPRPPSVNNMSVISMHWLSTSSFYTIYAPPGQLTPDAEQIHCHVSMDSKNNSMQSLKFSSPYLPFPGLRPPGEFLVCLRGWDPSKVLLFIGDGTSSDIGLIGSVVSGAEENWQNLSLEETSTPSLPLDKDQNDTILLGMDVDLTNSESYHHSTASGEALELPAHPVMYAYASDGTILAWHILNVTGVPYPGLVTSTSPPSVPPVPSSMVRELSSDMQTTPTISTPPSEASAIVTPSNNFGQPPAFSGPAFSSAFGQSTTFGSQPASVFTKAPSFEQPPTFGSASSPPPFGQATTPSFGPTAPGLGFGAFTSTGSSKFGQASFGFGGPSVTPTQPPPTSIPEESMAADDAPSLGSLGLGAANSQDADSKPSIFGKINTPISSDQQSTGSSLIKPGAGFGAFGSFNQDSPFAKPSTFTSAQQGPAAFGAPAFQAKLESTSSFSAGQTAFGGSAPAFGQPAFGQSSFGQTQTGGSVFGKTSLGFPQATSTNAGSGGAFSAFGSSAQNAFGAVAMKGGPSTRPAWATTDSSKPAESNPTGATTFAPTKPTAEPPELKTPTAISTKTTETSTTPVISSQYAARELIARDDDSRSPSPALNQLKAAAGAFSNLQTTPSVFVKPASGVFGELPKDSPFFAPKPAESKPVMAFALAPTTTTPMSAPPKAGSTAFGMSSFPGSGALKSAFPAAGVSGAQAQTTSIPSGSSAFSAFSTGGSGFTAFSSRGSTSFSDLLRSDGGDKASKTAESSDATPTKPAQGPLRPSVSLTPATTPPKEPPETPTTPAEPPKIVKEQEKPATPEAKTSETPIETKEEQVAEPVFIQEPSLESISSSTSSSYVKVSVEEEGEITEGVIKHGLGVQDDEASFLSDVPSESEDEEEEDDDDDDDEVEEPLSEVADEEETEERVQKRPQPAEIFLPTTPVFTRSPSTTPKAEHPKIRVSASPPPETPSPAGAPRVPDGHTSPPGSPVKDAASSSTQTPITAAKGPPPTASPFPLAPRSSSTRPARSSPLAGIPLVPEGEAEKLPHVSKSAPPATARMPSSQWAPTPPPTLPTEGDSSIPKAASTLPVTPVMPEKPAPSIFAPTVIFPMGEKPVASVFAAMTASATGEKPATSVSTPSSTPSPKPQPTFTFTDKAPTAIAPLTTTPLFSSTPVGPNLWGSQKPAEVAPSSPKAPQSLFGGQPSIFGAKGGPAPPLSTSSSPFIVPSTSPVPSAMSPSPKIPAPSPSPAPEQGLQAECTLLLNTINKELDNLKQLAMMASAKTGELKRTSGIMHQKSDLGDSRKWMFGDIEEFGRVLVDVQSDVKELKLQRVSLRKALKELDSNMLKVNTRKEEIARFNKAKTDTEFAKVLKIRTLAPEYSETQSQLRRSIRTIRDRVQKLEDHLQSSKKRINELRTGRPSIRPPSLDTVNRTFRNIDMAIDQQKQDVSQLRRRMAKLEISGGVGARGDQLAMSSSKRPLSVTPNVATTTAAALNAERSAQRLKKALLASRKQPLLNTTAVTSLVQTSFQTPQKPPVMQPDIKTPDTKSKLGESAFTLPSTPMMSFPSSFPSWSSPPSDVGSPNVAGSPSLAYDNSPSARNHRGGLKHHQKPIVLKKGSPSPSGPSAATTTPPPPSVFEWKPVEPVKPVSALPFSLRPGGAS